MANSPPGLSEWPRLRRLTFVQDKRDPIPTKRIWVHSWSAQNLGEVNSHLDKGHSRTQATPLLAGEADGPKKNQEVVRNLLRHLTGIVSSVSFSSYGSVYMVSCYIAVLCNLRKIYCIR